MLWDVFDRVYVINLPARQDRREEMEQQLRLVGASFADERVVLFPAVRPPHAGGFPSIGARGCFMSHLGVLRDARQREDIDNILILEDDCNFRKNMEKQSVRMAELFRAGGEILFYGGEVGTRSSVPSADDVGLVEIASERGIMGSHCIGLHRETAKRIADYFEKMITRPPGSPEGGPMHVDGAYSWFRKENPDVETWMAEPECVYQRSSATDVHEKRWFEKYPILSGIVRLLRKIKNRVAGE